MCGPRRTRFKWLKSPLEDECISVKIFTLGISERQRRQTAEGIDRKVILPTIQCQAGSHLSFKKKLRMRLLHQVVEPAKAKPRLKVKIRLISDKQGLSGCWTTRTMQKSMPTLITSLVSAPSNLDTHTWSHGCLSCSTRREWKRLKRSNAERLKMNVGNAGNTTKCEKMCQNFLWSGGAVILLQTLRVSALLFR